MLQQRISGEEVIRILRNASLSNKQLTEDEHRVVVENKMKISDLPGNIARTELEQILCGAGAGFILRNYSDELAIIIPELKPLFNFPQVSKYHNADVWEHTVRTVEHIKPDPILRMTMLLHDIGKPTCFTEDENGNSHFRKHSERGANMADSILMRLKYDKTEIELIHYLIETHDNNIEPTRECVREWLDDAGPDVMEQVIDVMIADACGKTEESEKEWTDIMTRTRDVMKTMISEGYSK